MANIKSAKKRILVTETRTAKNKAIKSKVKTMVKKVYAAIDEKDQEAAKAALKEAISTLNKAASKGVYHRNTVSRKISSLQK
ncbi:MAG: 30S ribosomal protein S20, partial [Lachnospiraceae bacterium]|nr:30S ribosomal protein S20 [Lachnospiraceae bacterium]